MTINEGELDALARVLCEAQGLAPDITMMRGDQEAWRTNFGSFQVITESNKPETAWRWFSRTALMVLEAGYSRPEPEKPQPTEAERQAEVLDEAGSVLPSFEDGFVAGGFTGDADWYTRSGLR
jgi:hypothetical protein